MIDRLLDEIGLRPWFDAQWAAWMEEWRSKGVRWTVDRARPRDRELTILMQREQWALESA